MKENCIEKYNIYIKLCLLVYINLNYINQIDEIYLVSFSLIYLILNISYFLFYKRIILIIVSTMSFMMGLKYIPLAMILYSFNTIELFINEK